MLVSALTPSPSPSTGSSSRATTPSCTPLLRAMRRWPRPLPRRRLRRGRRCSASYRGREMVRVCAFDGMKVFVNDKDHPPPHFHVYYGEHEALISMHDLEVIEGYLPPAKLRKALKWARKRR